MNDRLEALASMEYPGRFIILGKSANSRSNIAVYGITGRSPSSQARKLLYSPPGRIVVEPTDENILKQGNPDLLVYPAMIFSYDKLAVSNGKQTGSVFEQIEGDGNRVRGSVSRAHDNFTYEPDKPNFTPRISGVIHRDTYTSILGIITKQPDSEEALKTTFELSLKPGLGHLISTYTGVNTNPLPSFGGMPIEVPLVGNSPNETARWVYDSLAPAAGHDDFRVAVVAVYSDSKESGAVIHYPSHYIINRHESRASQ